MSRARDTRAGQDRDGSPRGPIHFTDALIAVGLPAVVVYAVVVALMSGMTGLRDAVDRWAETPFWDITSAEARPMLAVAAIGALLIAPVCARIFYRRTGHMLRTPRLMAILLATGIGGLMFAGRLITQSGGTPAAAVLAGGALMTLFGAMFLMSAGDARAMTMLGQDQAESLKRRVHEQRTLRRRMLAGRAEVAVRLSRARLQVVLDLAHHLRARDVQVVAEMDDGEFMSVQSRRPHAPVLLIAAALAIAGALGEVAHPFITDAMAAQATWGPEVVGALSQGLPVLATGALALILLAAVARTRMPHRSSLAVIAAAGLAAGASGLTPVAELLARFPDGAAAAALGGAMIAALGVIAAQRGTLMGRRAWGLTEELIPEHCAALDVRMWRVPGWVVAGLVLISALIAVVLPMAAAGLMGAAVGLLALVPDGHLGIEVYEAPGGVDVVLVPERAPDLNRDTMRLLIGQGGRLVDLRTPDHAALPDGPEPTFTG